jgi:hypothetical protein
LPAPFISVAANQCGERSPSYTKMVANSVFDWWMMLMPQPDSAGFHQRSVQSGPCVVPAAAGRETPSVQSAAAAKWRSDVMAVSESGDA